jgi:hypothetical protein
MESDWEIEIGPGLPIIDAQWAGLIDLRQAAEFNPVLAIALASRLPEIASLPGLDVALVQLNGPQSPVWTAKCDVWPLLDAAEFDPDEMAAPPEDATQAWALYIDLLPRSAEQWTSHTAAASWCKELCLLLRRVPVSCSRVDLVVRRAVIAPAMDIGVTAYLTACGPSGDKATQVLRIVLERFVDALCGAQR